jgi:hypothetical protein
MHAEINHRGTEDTEKKGRAEEWKSGRAEVRKSRRAAALKISWSTALPLSVLLRVLCASFVNIPDYCQWIRLSQFWFQQRAFIFDYEVAITFLDHAMPFSRQAPAEVLNSAGIFWIKFAA